MDNNQTSGSAPTPKQDHHVMAYAAYFGILVLIPLLLNKGDQFVKFHAKQGLLLLIAVIFVKVVSVIPVLGWLAGPILAIICVVWMIIGIINVANGKMNELPVIGQYARNFNF